MRRGLTGEGRCADVVGRGVRGSLGLQSLSHHPVVLMAFAGALGLQALSHEKCQPRADGAKTEDFWRGLRNGLDPLGESMQQPRKLQTKESPPSSMACLDGEGARHSLDALPLICLGRKTQPDLGTGLARPVWWLATLRLSAL